MNIKKAAKIFFYNFFSIYKNVSKILPKNKEKFSKRARERYQNLSAEGNTEKRQYARQRYRNLSEEENEKKPQ